MQIKGLTAGVFDFCHTGHLLMFEECTKHCDHLTVAMQVNPEERDYKNKPIETIFERYVRLRSCSFIDEIIPYETEEDLENLLYSWDYNIRFLGEEYENDSFTGCDIREDTFIFLGRDHCYSSTRLRALVLSEDKQHEPLVGDVREITKDEYNHIINS